MSRNITVQIIEEDGSVTFKIKKEDDYLIPNFQVKEFLANRDAGLDLAIVHRRVLNVCPVLRAAIGPFYVTSVLRTPAYNKLQGGDVHSDHMICNAFDFEFLKPLPLKEQFLVVLILGNHGFKNVGIYKNKVQFHASYHSEEIKAWEG